MEARANTGDYQLDTNAERMKQEFITHFQEEEYITAY
jgi:hypothetical protein